jgi:hypothetical protein
VSPVETKGNEMTQPNLYQLSGDGITVTYATTSFIGQPSFTYNDGTINKAFTGSEITVTSVPILGTAVSVVIRLTIDAGSTSFTLLIPRVNLDASGKADISTYGITADHKFTIGGPLTGQQDSYTAHLLKGTASRVFF